MNDLLEVIALHTLNQPNKIAVVEADAFHSYQDLEAFVDRASWAISENEMKPGGVIGYFGGAGLDRIVALLAAQKLGLTFVPLDPADPTAIHEVILRNSALTGLVATLEFATQARRLSDAVMILPTGKVERGEIDRFEPADVDDNSLSLIKYTSGSTGLPKGVPSSRAAEAHYGRIAVRMANLTEEDRVSFFGAYKTWAIYAALMAGTTIGCFDAKSNGARALMAWLADQKTSVIFCFPAIYRQMIAVVRPLPALRHIQLVGEPVTRADVEAFEKMCEPGAVLMNKYGSSENPWIAAYTHRHGDVIPGETLPMGYPVDTREVKLENPDGNPVPVTEVGEIVVSSEYAPKCYHDDPERSTSFFRSGAEESNRYYTGDLAYFDRSGCLRSMGRKDDQIKIRGYTVRPSSIEREIVRHPEVVEAAIVAVAYPGGV